jgi:hypothetical protein
LPGTSGASMAAQQVFAGKQCLRWFVVILPSKKAPNGAFVVISCVFTRNLISFRRTVRLL